MPAALAAPAWPKEPSAQLRSAIASGVRQLLFRLGLLDPFVLFALNCLLQAVQAIFSGTPKFNEDWRIVDWHHWESFFPVNLFENGKPCKSVKDVSVWLVPRTQRNKPLCKFTKCQLIRRLVQISTDFAEQVDTIIARKERQEVERQEAEQNACPICLDPLENQAQCTSPCGHTFCSSCFVTHLSNELSRGNTAKCPCCRRTTAEITNRW